VPAQLAVLTSGASYWIFRPVPGSLLCAACGA